MYIYCIVIHDMCIYIQYIAVSFCCSGGGKNSLSLRDSCAKRVISIYTRFRVDGVGFSQKAGVIKDFH